jgi:uncharacterized protein YbcI
VGNVSNVSGLACILGYRVSSLPMKYMGLSLDASFKAKFIWDTIIKKMEKRFSWVEKTTLSKGSQVMMIKSTLSNLPTYFLSLFPI